MHDPGTPTALREQAAALRLHGLIEHWAEVMAQPEQASWVAQMLTWEATERGRRSLERRLREAHIGRFKPLADFDWAWPKQIDRAAIEELMTLEFLKDASNVVLVGPNGVGKSMCACNIGYQAVLAGHTALLTTAGQLLGELAALDSDSGLRRKLRQYAAPDVLIIDEVGYLSYSNRHADLLFELVSRRYQHKSTVVTTNRAFADWGEVFPNAACVVSLIDRLMHRAEVVRIDGDSYRAKEAQERQAQRLAAPLSSIDRALEILMAAPPDVMNHNLETVPRLYKEARPGSDYAFSLNLLKKFKALHPGVPTKSGLMVGLGETDDEILAVMRDMRAHDIDMLTIGQYLAPSGHHLPVRRYVHPDTFRMFEREATAIGFSHAAVGALVRSSYHADQQAHAAGVPDAAVRAQLRRTTRQVERVWRHRQATRSSTTAPAQG
jgi:DNA replication protein DnaC